MNFEGCPWVQTFSRVCFSHMNNVIVCSKVFVYTTSTPALTLVTKNSLDIFMSSCVAPLFHVDIFIFFLFFHFCVRLNQHTHLLTANPAEAEFSSLRTGCQSDICDLTHRPSREWFEFFQRSLPV